MLLEASWTALGGSWGRKKNIWIGSWRVLEKFQDSFQPSWGPKGSQKGGQEGPKSSPRGDSSRKRDFFKKYCFFFQYNSSRLGALKIASKRPGTDRTEVTRGWASIFGWPRPLGSATINEYRLTTTTFYRGSEHALGQRPGEFHLKNNTF